jgi:uncharacterized protein YydD (DUF2326 family)
LIHFCLGAKVTKDFQEQLKDWSFSLDFELNKGTEHRVERSPGNPNTLLYDGQEMKVKDFNKQMGQNVFRLDEDDSQLSFRALIARFIRMGKSGYTSFDKFRDKEQPPTDIINTSYLLGLDVMLVRSKCEHYEDLKQLKTGENNLKNDPILKNLLLGSNCPNDIKLRILDIERQVIKLEENIENFEIAEDYGQIKQEADEVSLRLQAARDARTKYQIALSGLQKSMQRKADIHKDQLVGFFEEAKVSLGDAVVKKLEEVEQFNERLQEDRERILSMQKNQYETLLNEVTARISELERLEDEKLQYLDSHGALDDYQKMVDCLSECRKKKEKLEQYIQLQREYKQRIDKLKVTISNENLKTEEYLDCVEGMTKRHMTFFHDLVQEFYQDKTSGLQIQNNDKDGKSRFIIDARITDDNGDGVNEAKIFCFDWTVLTAQKNHDVKFLVHDNRIISETDPRQVGTMFRIADRLCREYDFQYILTVNESSLELLKNELGEDYKRLVTDNEVLKLDDSSDKAKLLGIQIDLKYE